MLKYIFIALIEFIFIIYNILFFNQKIILCDEALCKRRFLPLFVNYMLTSCFSNYNIDLLQELYIENQNKILLERNAEIERFDLLMKLAEYNSRNDLHDLFKW